MITSCGGRYVDPPESGGHVDTSNVLVDASTMATDGRPLIVRDLPTPSLRGHGSRHAATADQRATGSAVGGPANPAVDREHARALRARRRVGDRGAQVRYRGVSP